MIKLKKSQTADTRTCDFANTTKEEKASDKAASVLSMSAYQFADAMLKERQNCHD